MRQKNPTNSLRNNSRYPGLSFAFTLKGNSVQKLKVLSQEMGSPKS